MITYTAYRNVFPIWALGRYFNKYGNVPQPNGATAVKGQSNTVLQMVSWFSLFDGLLEYVLH